MRENQTGVISAIRYVKVGSGKLCEVKVKVDGRDTHWLPKAGMISKAFKLHIPPTVGDQVIVHNEYGKDEDGYVTDNVAFTKIHHSSSISSNTMVLEAKDGTKFTHNVKGKVLKIKTPCKVTVDAKQDITLRAPNINVYGNLKVKGDISNDGDIVSTGDITGSNLYSSGKISAMGDITTATNIWTTNLFIAGGIYIA